MRACTGSPGHAGAARRSGYAGHRGDMHVVVQKNNISQPGAKGAGRPTSVDLSQVSKQHGVKSNNVALVTLSLNS